MCGISGVIYKNKNKKDYTSDIHEMNRLIHHRGPDDSGVYIGDDFSFGHTRLSIIDISNAGHQPMVYNSQYIITYNGEVYNYIELRQELLSLGYQFKSHSDTEVILAGYDYWKEEVVHKLNGMFAFAIYDLATKKLFLARDRTGVKPLYYYQTDDELYFFSEPKQVVIPKIVEALPNEDAIKEYLAYQFTLSDDTFFRGIKKLLPGHVLELQNNSIIIRQYWNLDKIEIDEAITYAEAKKEIRHLVEDAVRLRLRSDVKVGCYLSGGIDSSVVSSLAAHELNHLNTYTFTSKAFPKQDESKLAKKTADYLKSSHHEVEIDFNDILKTWKKSVYYMDEPEMGYSLLSQMKISQEVSKDLKVILGGQGGDELFYGYGWHTQIATSLRNLLKNFSFSNAITVIKNILINQSLKQNIRFLLTKIHSSSSSIENEYFNFWKSNGAFDYLKDQSSRTKFINKLAYTGSLLAIKRFEYKHWLQGLLHVEDRSSMYASIESRVPLLDYRIAEYVFRLKPEYMIDGILNKSIFIDSFKDILLKDIYNNKQKKGYSSPIGKWFEVPEVNEYINQIFKNENSYIYQYIKYTKRSKLNHRQIWMLISVELWYEIFIKRELNFDH